MLETIGNRIISQGSILEFTVQATDPENDYLTCTASNLPSGAIFNSLTRIFSFIPEAASIYNNLFFTVFDGQYTASQTISITVLPVIPRLLTGPSESILPLAVIYYGHPTQSIERIILDIRPQYFIVNSSQGLWGKIGGHEWNVFQDISVFKTAGIKVIGYITAGYEGTESGGGINPKWYTLEMNRKLIQDMANIDHVNGIFIDECSNFPDENGKAYLQELTALAHSYGLITWGNVGMNNFDPWFFTEGGFDLVHSTEDWRSQNLSKVQIDWGYRISVTGFSQKYTAQDAFKLTVNGWRKGLAYCYITNTSMGYDDLPPWLSEYADLLRQYKLHPEQYQPPPEKGNTTGIIAGTPVPSGAYNEYNFTLRIINTSVDGLISGQEVWCVSNINDFPNVLTVGGLLTGNLDRSRGWWVLKNTNDTMTR